MEFELYEQIRDSFCKLDSDVIEGKMMSSPAIHYKNKVFAFFSRKNKMVFKLGKSYPLHEMDFEINAFNPFKNKGPLAGWYEVGYQHGDKWEALCNEALEMMRTNDNT